MNPWRDQAYLIGFTGLFALSFAVHLVRVHRGAVALPPPRRGGAGARLFGPLFVSYVYWVLRPLFRAAERTRVTPNQVTLASLLVAAAGAVAIATGHFALASALALVLGGGALDIVDGHLARAKNLATSAGAFLDSTIDRVCDGLVFGGCVVYFAGTSVMGIALAVLVLSFTVSYARSRGEVLGVTGSEGLMQRADRLALLGAALASSSALVTAGGLCLLAVLNGVTAFQRIVWTMQQLHGQSAPGQSGGAPSPQVYRIGA